MKNKKVLFVIVFFVFIVLLNVPSTYSIYKETLTQNISLTVSDSSDTYVYFETDGGSSVLPMQVTPNQPVGTLPTTTKSGFNFTGWYDGNGREITKSEIITATTTFYAHWQKIVCTKVTNVSDLNTETCSGSNGCLKSNTGYAQDDTITYGSVYGANSPVAGDAFNCDVNNNGTFDETDGNGKHIERFYFVRDKENSGSEDTGVLIYYTIFDGTHGRVDTQNDSNIGSTHYATASTWLPTSSTWTNTELVDFDPNNGKVSRFLTVADLESICGPLKSDGTQNTKYLTDCFGGSNPNWFIFENSRFQSSSRGRAGIWLETDGVKYYRIQTSTLDVDNYSSGDGGENTAKPVIEVPMSALEGYVYREKYTITYEMHGGTAISSFNKYDGETLGELPTPTRPLYTFDGWYSTYSNNEFSNPVTSATVVHGNMTLHAKWVRSETNTVTFNANGGTVEEESILEVEVNNGDTIDPLPIPTRSGYYFFGWYVDKDVWTEQFTTSDTVNTDIEVFARWETGNYVAIVEGVGGYETLASAISNVPTGTSTSTKVTLLQNVVLSEGITIPSDKWVKLDGGNHTISPSSNSVILFTNNGKMDIISGSMTTNASRLINTGNGSITNISGGTLTNTASSSSSNVIENGNATINITGGSIICHSQGAAINNRSNGGILNISSGEIKGTNTTKGQAVYIEGANSRVNISGDAYLESVSGVDSTNSRATIDNNGGRLTITGGTIVSKEYNAVNNRASGATTIIGDNTNPIDISTPVLRAKGNALERTNGTVNVYDGIFETLENATAVSGTINKPSGINFTDSTIDVAGVTYVSTYLYSPTVTVRFDANGGTVEGLSYKDVVVNNGSTIGADMPQDPIRSNYYFDGWYDGNTQITSSTTVTNYIPATAKWEQSVSNATINGTLSVAVASTENILITESDIEDVTYTSSNTNIATVDAYTGAVTGQNIGTATITITGVKSGDTRTVTVTVTPMKHVVTFLEQDGTTIIQTEEIEDGSSFEQSLPIPTDTNYVFSGWTIQNSVAPFTGETTVTGDMSVVASWKEKVSYATLSTSPDPFELVIGNNGTITLLATSSGDDVEEFTLSSGDTSVATVSGNTVTGEDVGTTTITITGNLSGTTKTVSVNVDVLKYTVTFKDEDTTIKTVRIEAGTMIGVSNMAANQTKTNYLFDGWFIQNSLTPVTDQTTVTGDIIAVAGWTPTIALATIPDNFSMSIGTTKTLTVTGPNGMESYTFTSNDTSIATVDANTGVVSGEDLGTTSITITGSRSNTTVTVPVLVHPLTREITFKDGADTYATREVYDGDYIGVSNMPSDPTKTNYIFDGWYIQNSMTPFTSQTTVSNSDIIVEAKWIATVSVAVFTPSAPYNIRLGSTKTITLSGPNGCELEDYTYLSSNTNYVTIVKDPNNGDTIYGEGIGSVTITVTGVTSGATTTISVTVNNNRTITFDPDNNQTPYTMEVEYGTTIADAIATQSQSLPTDPTKTGYTFDRWEYFDGVSMTSTHLDLNKVITTDETYIARWAVGDVVAAIGTNYYSTLQAAIDAVNTTTHTEIRIIKDVINPVGRTTVGANDLAQNITIDANGHELSCGGDTTGNLILVETGGTLRVKNGTFTCGTDGLATLETHYNATLYIESGTVSNTNNRGAVYNTGTTYILGGTITSSSKIRATVYNDGNKSVIVMSGGTINQTSPNSSDKKGKGAIQVGNGRATITGGTITSTSSNSGAIDHEGSGTLVIGTDDTNNSYDVTSPVIQGNYYGVVATANFSIYDGIIKGKTGAVSDETKITGTETGSTKQDGTEGDYHTLYYTSQVVVQKYRINFHANDGVGAPAYIDFDLNEPITVADLPAPTKGVYTFDGWYTDVNLNTAFSSFTPTVADEVDYYASWSYSSSLTPVNHVVTSDAMSDYFSNVSTWSSADSQIAVNQDSNLSNDDHSTYTTNMRSNFNNNSCSKCEGEETANSCNNPSQGTQCDKAKGYDTGISGALDVYLFENGAKTGQPLTYITVSNGVIYNMIPGKSYYWESQSDNTIYGVISATKDSTNYRRTLNTSVRNLRDLGGMAVSYTANGDTVTGTIKYERLYRGAQIASGQTGVNELKQLGITREIDLRQNGDGNGGQTKFEAANYDVSVSDSLYTRNVNTGTYSTDGYKDVKITNYHVNPSVNTYFSAAHSDNFDDLKQAMKAVMRQIVNHENVFFHCTIGADRTGTLAYFLEGLLGVSEEDRLRDYEMTYYFGLVNRTRFHNNLSTSNINPRFYAMYKSYPTVADIEAFYKTHPESDDDSLLAAFRQEMIDQN